MLWDTDTARTAVARGRGGFNSATALMLWDTWDDPESTFSVAVLQFGHSADAVGYISPTSACSSGPECFNSATALMLWDTCTDYALDTVWESLQFGHSADAVGYGPPGIPGRPGRGGFNSATALMLWDTPELEGSRRSHFEASIRPQR